MENEHMEMTEQETQQEVYVPRPVWQVWAARLGVVVVVVAFILYLLHIASGGTF